MGRQGNAAYEDAAQYLFAEFSSFGLEVMSHRYEYTDMLGAQNPEAYNVCAYKWGSLYIESGWSSEHTSTSLLLPI
ncbi:MAG: hypothetical protein Ct9H90mP1_3040 [Methanobacteriota archaeon]|nr:MAG: hypothetical protein Ct9H90mP1_3040 [Euryarchaeota archaeon]